MSTKSMSRRGFVKSAAAGVAAGAIATPVIALAAESAAGDAPEATKDAQAEFKDITSQDTSTEYAHATPENRWTSEASAAWRTPCEPVAEGDITDAGTYDVVVVGGGQSGTWAAKSCAENGLSVAVIEQQAEDAMQYVGGEVGTINNKWALEHGADETDGQAFMREIFRRNATRSNQAFIRDYVNHSGEFLQKVIEEMGEDWVAENAHVGSCPHDERMIMDPSGFNFYTGTVIFRPPTMKRQAWAWNDVMHKMAQDARDAGATWFFSNHAEYLEKDDSGRVTSVIMKGVDDGAAQRVTGTKAVVLAGGDFNGNTDMLRDINDEYRHLAESLGDIEIAAPLPIFYSRDGSAIAMGVWAGGHIEVGPHAGMNTGQASLNAPWGPGSLTLNQKGKRFCDECAGGTEGIAYMIPRQPAGSVVTFEDANWQDLTYAMPPAHGAVDVAHANNWPLLVETMGQVKPGDAPGECNNQDDTYEVYCADTMEELVDMVGVWDDDQKAAALEQVKRYQDMAAAGLDEDYAKDPRILAVTKLDTPPFYAVVAPTSAISTGLCQTCGLDVDDDHHVVDTAREPIPGLFALGNSSGNRFIVQYATPLSGMSLGYCLTEGTLFGERLAAGEIA